MTAPLAAVAHDGDRYARHAGKIGAAKIFRNILLRKNAFLLYP
jgi:hypothetical protein